MRKIAKPYYNKLLHLSERYMVMLKAIQKHRDKGISPLDTPTKMAKLILEGIEELYDTTFSGNPSVKKKKDDIIKEIEKQLDQQIEHCKEILKDIKKKDLKKYGVHDFPSMMELKIKNEGIIQYADHLKSEIANLKIKHE